MYATAVQMHPHLDAEALDDIVITFSGQYGIKRQRPGLEFWMPKLGRKSGQGNDARQSLCCPNVAFGLFVAATKQPPAPGERIHLGGFKGPLAIQLSHSFPILHEIGIAA